ncbi:MAG: hypothetical protein ACLQU3_11860 [Limisphaerales bacterium]
MRETFPIRLLLRLLQATPEQLVAIERILDGQRSAVWQKGAPPGNGTSQAAQPLPQSPPHFVGPADPFCYSLRRQRACWLLDFKDGPAQLKREIGLGYVACLLSQPDEPVPSATLFARFSAGRRKNLAAQELPDPETGLPVPVTDGVGIAQWPPDKDEVEARSRYRAQLLEYEETIGNPDIPESERAEAQRLYDDLAAFLKEHYRPAPEPGHAVTKLVHRSIQRLCDHLREPIPGEKAPSPVAVAFAEYIAEHILAPSRRYTRAKPGARVRIARGELAGRLIFECPPGDRWSVNL